MRFMEETDMAAERRGKPIACTVVLLTAALMWCWTGPAYPQPPQAPPLISAVGIGHPPAESRSATQAKAMAERAALLQAIREAAKQSGRQAPMNYRGPVRVGATIQGFRITRITPLPDGSVEIEVSVPPAGVTR
jgi:hypothetical protein